MAMTYTFIAGDEDSDVSHTFTGTPNVATATITLIMKRDIDDSTTDISIADGSFDKTSGASGIVTWPFTSANLATAGTYWGTIKAVIDADDTVQDNISMFVREAVT